MPKHCLKILALGVFLILFSVPARAEFMLSNAIVEFNGQNPQQDIELISRSEQNEYVETELYEIINPGREDEQRRRIANPAEGGLLVTPDKTILTGKSRKILRLILLRDPGDQERIYRLVIKPVIKGVESETQLGLKVLVGYEALVIVRPKSPETKISLTRKDNILSVANSGNTNVLLQSGQQCLDGKDCKTMPALRVYAGNSEDITLPHAAPGSYFVWDGQTLSEQRYP